MAKRAELAEISKARQAIANASVPEQSNEWRAQLKAIRRYLASRKDQYLLAFEAAKLQCEAAAKAGELWAGERPGKGAGGPGREGEISPSQSWQEAGFSDRMDASICVRLGELDSQDRQLYYDEMLAIGRYPSEYGLHTLWKTINFVEDESRPWLRVYSIWNFAKPDDRFGQSHPGMIPGQIMQNLNWYYTQPGDLVVDLFAGGGSTLDVCQYEDDDFGRRECLAFDRAPVRKDIVKHDLADGLPRLPKAALVFLDPPYGAQKADAYSADSTDLANLMPAEYRRQLSEIVQASLAIGRVVALIIGASQLDGGYIDHAAELISDVGAPSNRIIVPYSTQQYAAYDVVRAKRQKEILNLHRDLLVWAK